MKKGIRFMFFLLYSFVINVMKIVFVVNLFESLVKELGNILSLMGGIRSGLYFFEVECYCV